MVEAHLGLVRSIAKKIALQCGGPVDLDELISYGQQGLVQAAHTYDPERGAAFSTYAYYRVRGAIFDGIHDMSGVPKWRRLAFERNADAYLEEVSQEPSPPGAVAAAERLAGAVTDLAVAYVACSEQIEEAQDMETPDPAVAAERRESHSLVWQAVDALPEKERLLIELMYVSGMGLVEAAEKLEISKGWASKMHARALRRLRHAAEASPPLGGAPPGAAIRV